MDQNKDNTKKIDRAGLNEQTRVSWDGKGPFSNHQTPKDDPESEEQNKPSSFGTADGDDAARYHCIF